MESQTPSDRKGPLYAVAPGVSIVLFEGLIWALAAMSGDNDASVLGFIALVLAVAAGVLMPIVIVTTRQKDAWVWAIASLAFSSFGIVVGFFLCIQAATNGCGGECFG